MKSVKLSLVSVGIVALVFLGACSQNEQAANPDTSPTGEKTAPSTSPGGESKNSPSSHSDTPQKGGQVVESGAYHLQLVPEKGEKGTHLDFYLLKGEKHETVPNAKVTAQMQTPDGKQSNLNFTYDSADKHYSVLLPDKTPGQYQLKITADTSGEKVNGRFSFNQ